MNDTMNTAPVDDASEITVWLVFWQTMAGSLWLGPHVYLDEDTMKARVEKMRVLNVKVMHATPEESRVADVVRVGMP